MKKIIEKYGLINILIAEIIKIILFLLLNYINYLFLIDIVEKLINE